MNFASWWGRQTIEPQRTDLWQLGPLCLWIQPLLGRWRLTWTYSADWLDSRVRIVPGSGGETPPADAQQIYCVSGAGASPRADLLFVPALAARPLITRLATPLHILPGETTHLYIVSPLSLRVAMADSGRLLHEIPTFRPSDTWFGPISPAGELCYASPVPAFLELREVPLRLQCAISAVSIRNAGREALRLDRINVPLPRLSLFYSPRTGFWTDAFSLICEDESDMASLRLERQPPPEANPNQFVAGPRVNQAPNAASVVRAFTRLFGERPTP